jgi:uncharacterized protein YodC (DUF2158 family)
MAKKWKKGDKVTLENPWNKMTVKGPNAVNPGLIDCEYRDEKGKRQIVQHTEDELQEWTDDDVLPSFE